MEPTIHKVLMTLTVSAALVVVWAGARGYVEDVEYRSFGADTDCPGLSIQLSCYDAPELMGAPQV